MSAHRSVPDPSRRAAAHRATPRMRPSLRRSLTAVVLAVTSGAGALAGAGPASAAATWWVATTGANTTTCGLSSATPCATVTYTIAKSAFADGDTINVQPGTYSDRPLFGAKGASVVGQGPGATFSGTNTGFAIGSLLPAGKTLRLTNLVLTAGRNPNGLGGGLAIANGGAAITTDVTIQGNNAASQGGGAWVGASTSLTMNGGAVTGNTAASAGGGIYNAGTLTINGTTIQGNSAPNGGGIENVASAALTSATLSSNTANGAAIANGGNGGGILNTGTLSLSDSKLDANRAVASTASSVVTGYGGGVFNGPLTANSAPQLTLDSTFVQGGNVSGGNATIGGGIANLGNVFNLSGATAGKVTASRLLMLDNVAGAAGGMFTSGPTTLVGSLIGRNSATHASAGWGGGLYVAHIPASGPVTVVALDSTSLTDNSAKVAGGGLMDLGGTTVEVRNGSTVDRNSAVSGAGAFVAGSLTVRSSLVTENDATGQGGGVYAGSSSAVDSPRVVLVDSSASNNVGSQGGGVYLLSGAALDATGGALMGNSGAAGGAAYVGDGGKATFNGTNLNGNTASTVGGAAIYNSGDTTVTDSYLFDNHAVHTTGSTGLGGALFSGSNTANAQTSLRVVASTISGNDAYAGSALVTYSPGSGATNKTLIDNSTIHANTSSSQYGAIEQFHPLTITNSTITGNTAAAGGWGALAMFGPGSVGVAGTILAANSPVSCSGAPRDGGYNLAGTGDTACGFTASRHDLTGAPRLGSLSANGGPTPTRLPNPDSPVLDVVPTATATGLTDALTGSAVTLCGAGATDQRGVDRPQGARCDVGAVEAAQHAPVVAGPAVGDDTVTVPGDPITFTTTGSPQPTLSESGALPDGVTFVDNGDGTATLSGTPAADTDGVYPIVVTATNEAGSDQLDFTLTVHKLPLDITTTSLPGGTVAAAYSASVSATGGHPPYTFTLDGGSLPAGLSLADDGTISGTPTGPAGTATFTVKVTDTREPILSDSQDLSITIAKGVSHLQVDPVVLQSSGINLKVGILSATLTGGSPAQPLPGQTISFKAGTTTVCTAVTGADGKATCGTSVSNTLLVILNLGVTATYAGNGSWLPASGSAGLTG